jgi:ketosteroid isomerase-like protein
VPTGDAKPFVDEWVRAWNAHDVEAVLAHFHDDVLFPHPSRHWSWRNPGE